MLMTARGCALMGPGLVIKTKLPPSPARIAHMALISVPRGVPAIDGAYVPMLQLARHLALQFRMRRAVRVADRSLVRSLLVPNSLKGLFCSLKNRAGHWRRHQITSSSCRTVTCCAPIVAAQARAVSAPDALASLAEYDAISAEVESASRAANEILRLRKSFTTRAYPWVRVSDFSRAWPGDCALAATLRMRSRAALDSDC